jgi:hypothetical protein
MVFMHPRACHVLAIAQKGTRTGPEDPGTKQGEEVPTRFREQALMIQVRSSSKAMGVRKCAPDLRVSGDGNNCCGFRLRSWTWHTPLRDRHAASWARLPASSLLHSRVNCTPKCRPSQIASTPRTGFAEACYEISQYESNLISDRTESVVIP